MRRTTAHAHVRSRPRAPIGDPCRCARARPLGRCVGSDPGASNRRLEASAHSRLSRAVLCLERRPPLSLTFDSHSPRLIPRPRLASFNEDKEEGERLSRIDRGARVFDA